jgi:hypothetical protein
VDTSGFNGSFSGTPTLLATAGANTAFRGVALTPVPEPATVGCWPSAGCLPAPATLGAVAELR